MAARRRGVVIAKDTDSYNADDLAHSTETYSREQIRAGVHLASPRVRDNFRRVAQLFYEWLDSSVPGAKTVMTSLFRPVRGNRNVLLTLAYIDTQTRDQGDDLVYMSQRTLEAAKTKVTAESKASIKHFVVTLIPEPVEDISAQGIVDLEFQADGQTCNLAPGCNVITVFVEAQQFRASESRLRLKSRVLGMPFVASASPYAPVETLKELVAASVVENSIPGKRTSDDRPVRSALSHFVADQNTEDLTRLLTMVRYFITVDSTVFPDEKPISTLPSSSLDEFDDWNNR